MYEGGYWVPQANFDGDAHKMLEFEEGCDTEEARADFTIEEIWVREIRAPPPEDRWDDEPALGRDPKTGRFVSVPWYEQCKDSTWKGAQPWWHVRYRH